MNNVRRSGVGRQINYYGKRVRREILDDLADLPYLIFLPFRLLRGLLVFVMNHAAVIIALSVTIGLLVLAPHGLVQIDRQISGGTTHRDAAADIDMYRKTVAACIGAVAFIVVMGGTAKQLKLTKATMRTDQFLKAAEHLVAASDGKPAIERHLAAVYVLRQWALDALREYGVPVENDVRAVQQMLSSFVVRNGSTPLIRADVQEAMVDLAHLSTRGLVRDDPELDGAVLNGLRLGPLHTLSGWSLRRAQLRDAHLAGVSLRSAKLDEADFTNADLRGVDFSYANLSGAILNGADLTGANLTSAANWTAEQLRSAHVDGNTLMPAGCTLFAKEVIAANP